ncbi:uncharacterized protein K444DRAFT_50212 [Hyaloscypha bicolor E]|uniref:Uncharacterized protein n=1 Tax=Hyaloscypha bicolor E TaxID=1095630 RepID=A0A2J6T2L9_9HELO|nr:uncharacterized protein K444DRAFT_50212 [Hyaloscypha bicolor E]PMD57271.1 hypothetical protein K444DRAFT_50212 [Hyaloscypha bicolor E]
MTTSISFSLSSQDPMKSTSPSWRSPFPCNSPIPLFKSKVCVSTPQVTLPANFQGSEFNSTKSSTSGLLLLKSGCSSLAAPQIISPPPSLQVSTGSTSTGLIFKQSQTSRPPQISAKKIHLTFLRLAHSAIPTPPSTYLICFGKSTTFLFSLINYLLQCLPAPPHPGTHSLCLQ